MRTAIEIIHEDNHLLGVFKPAGLLVQGDRTGDASAIDLAKAYLKETYDKPGNVFLGLVHRVDRPVSGVVLFARTSKAASRLTQAFAGRTVEKSYLAVVEGAPPRDEDELVGFLERKGNRSRLVLEGAPGAREARLSYRLLEKSRGLSLIEVRPLTGRHHQIRVQLAAEGCPVVGDLKYDASEALPDRSIALHSARLSLDHPVGGDRVTILASPPTGRPWSRFRLRLGVWSPGQ